MRFDDIEKVIALFEKANISSLEVEDDGLKIKLTKELDVVHVEKEIVSSPKVPVNIEESEQSNALKTGEQYIKSPLVGTYHQAAYSDAEPFVEEGKKVKKGDKLCIIEAMKVMNEIVAPNEGVIKKILVKEGDMIEYDQALFVLGD